MIPRWLLWTLVTLVSWGVWAVLGKSLEDDLSAEHSQLLSTVGLIPILVAIFFLQEQVTTGNRQRGIALALASGIVSSLGNIFYYQLLNSGASAATVIPLTALAPLVTVLLAVGFLREGLNRMQLLGVVLSLAAIYLFSVTDEKGIDYAWLLLALAPIGLWGLAGLLQKMATNEISARSTAIWFFVAFFALAGWLMLQKPLPKDVSFGTWGLAIALGFTLALGNLTILLAFASGGKASIIAPMAGLYPLISIPIAIVKFGERIDWRQSLGIALALGAVVLLSIETPTTISDQRPSGSDITT